MMYNKEYFKKVFSDKRLERYLSAHSDEQKAILHYQCNIELAESVVLCLSVFEIALRNSLCRELETMTGRKDWYDNESICLNLTRVTEIHATIIEVMGWINKDLPVWVETFDRFPLVKDSIKAKMELS